MEKLGSRNSVLGPWFSELGSGKVAGKVLIVDQYAGPAKILILLETVIEWCLGKASNIFSWAPLPKIQGPRFKAQVTVSTDLGS
jgi:hypothetical protein